ncbi:ABC transporter ATP-binding protein [Nitratireductor sp. ZSWI3]|uniref:ABC transporter ATP-binding protein n=1 Tax=Nitratireductor sp. ZSWI3 TaxID=2966359 RepID=UPI0021504E57|nr:ABC transporter ATP-binding protein [Nitratireductor sp. ZSWI3]MCR4264787.1 ABC transporter ATP-binding protein [Nitratireductor sp. ZSWI3]
MVTLRLDSLGARYGRNLTLEGVTTPAFKGGEVVAVIGPNAAGKSTLFKRMAGILSGPGTLHAENARKGRRGICYMPQDTSANAVLTIYESVLLARKQGTGWRVDAADLMLIDETLEALGIAGIAFRTIGELSGGQRQLASLAQTLVREPEILLMDEPTSALDLARQVEVLDLVRNLAKARGMVVLIALHDLNHALRFCDQVMVIAGGRLVACGAAPSIITSALLRDIYHVEARIEPCSKGIGHVIIDGPVAKPRTVPKALAEPACLSH